MIVSPSRGFAFVAVPRTGTHAVRSVMRPWLAPGDWEQCTRFERRLCPVPALAAIGHGHITAVELRSFIGPAAWQQLFSFAFVRDPVDRFVSAHRLLNRARNLSDGAAQADMRAVLADPGRIAHILYRPQADFVGGPDGQHIDLIARYDQFERELARICTRIGIAFDAPPRINASPQAAAIDPALRSAIRAHYARDYARFAFLDHPA